MRKPGKDVMRGKIIKGIAGFYYVYVVDIGYAVDIGHAVDIGQINHISDNENGDVINHGMASGNAAGISHAADIDHTARHKETAGPEGDAAEVSLCSTQKTEAGRVYECKAKGIFRKDKRKPLVGDDVEMDVLDEEKHLGNITELLPRHSELIRPAVANVDQALIIFAVASPRPSFNLLDRFLIMMARQKMDCLICFNKLDMEEGQEAEKYIQIYQDCGYRTMGISAMEGRGIQELKGLLAGKTTTLAGPSGVGKSTLINCLQSDIVMETGEVSEKIARGKHTTRHVELIALGENTYILDTPGFSSLELFSLDKEQLAGYYPEFAPYEKYCKFGGCSHVAEKECGVKDAAAEGSISKMRYENYCMLYKELKEKKVRY